MNFAPLIQALAYAVIATVAVLTYLRARKTLLLPLRTEAFKVQIEELRKLVAHYAGKAEFELRDHFGFPELLELNVQRTFDRFVRDVYGAWLEEGPGGEPITVSPYSIVHESVMDTDTDGAERFFRGQSLRVYSPKPASASEARDWWEAFQCTQLKVPEKHHKSVSQIEEARSSPLLPETVADALKALEATIQRNRELLFEALTRAGRDLSRRYPGDERPETMEYRWVSDLYYAKFEALRPRVDALLRAVRLHWATVLLLKPEKS